VATVRCWCFNSKEERYHLWWERMKKYRFDAKKVKKAKKTESVRTTNIIKRTAIQQQLVGVCVLDIIYKGSR